MKDAASRGPALDAKALAIVPLDVAAPYGADIDPELHGTLPRDHPAWQRDIVSISARARTIVAALRPVVVRVLSFWDHVTRTITLGSRTLEIDPSGCYRVR